MYQRFYSPNVLAVASSLVGEDSLSHHVDPAIGVYIIDRFVTVYFAYWTTLEKTGNWSMLSPLLTIAYIVLCVMVVCSSD